MLLEQEITELKERVEDLNRHLKIVKNNNEKEKLKE